MPKHLYRMFVMSVLFVLSGCTDLTPLQPLGTATPTATLAARCIEPLALLTDLVVGETTEVRAAEQMTELSGNHSAGIVVTEDTHGKQLVWSLDVLSGLGETTYHLYFDADILTRVDAVWSDDEGPKVRTLFECLGPPTLYAATVVVDTEPRFKLEFWYPDRGIFVRHSQIVKRRDVPAPDETAHIGIVSVVQPGTPDAMLRALYAARGTPLSDKYVTVWIERLQAWTGAWDQLDVVNCYQEPDRCADGQ